MKIYKYEGYNDESRFKEAVITLLEQIIENTSKEKQELAEVITNVEKKTRVKKKKEETEVK